MTTRTSGYILIYILLFVTLSCTQEEKILYTSDAFGVYTDKVVQGEFVANIISPTNIVSNYQSKVSENYSSLLKFRFSINEKDNEMASSSKHWIIIKEGEHQSPILKFGEKRPNSPNRINERLAPNYEYTFKVDMNPVFKQFKEKGYYKTYQGKRIAKEDFKALYIAGGSKPLTWDFSNLDENGLELKDPDGDGIYELTVVLNPYDENLKETKEWNLTEDVTAKTRYKSDQKIVDALYNLSLEEALLNIENDSTLRTGAKWGGVWTRDVSYSTLLAFAYHEPEVAKISLMKKVKRNRIIQDTGSGGAWPVSSDRTTWALAAWEIYKVTGDKVWLKTAFIILKNSLEDDQKTIKSEMTGMQKGESSFLDWREQTYPKWMSNKDIYISENLGTNVVHYQAHIILSKMANILGEPNHVYLKRADEIKQGINEFLWMPERGYYGQYLYGRSHLILSPKFEALGEALAVLFDVADKKQAKSIIEKSPVTAYGATCIYPQIPGIPPYHNNGIWPFVQSYWNLAAAKVGNEAVLNHGLAAIYRAGALFLTNYENFVADNGDYEGTEINSHRMLWSMAGNLAMVHRVFMGMSFEEDGLNFAPVIPQVYSGNKALSNFKYRNAILNITVIGFGNKIGEFMLDGEKLNTPFIPASIEGNHDIQIVMANNSFPASNINLVENLKTLPTVQANYNDQKISWKKIPEARAYKVFKNGVLVKTIINANTFKDIDKKVAEYMIVAIDENENESFSCEPILIKSKTAEQFIEIEDHVQASLKKYSNYSGEGFVETTTKVNTRIEIPVSVNSRGCYLLDIKYSNGSGPWNTDNNCGIRSLFVNGEYNGVLVFPQRGKGEWSDWDYTNQQNVTLNKGNNTILISLEDWNINMDGKINNAMLDYIRLIKID